MAAQLYPITSGSSNIPDEVMLSYVCKNFFECMDCGERYPDYEQSEIDSTLCVFCAGDPCADEMLEIKRLFADLDNDEEDITPWMNATE